MGSGDNVFTVVAKNIDVLAMPLLSLVFPLYCSIKAIETKSRADDQQWLTYWVLYSLITLFELTFAKVLEWFPIWSYAKLIAICWLVLPYFNGAAYVYENWIRPFYRNPQVKLWYVPRKKDIFSKPDDVLTAAEKYIEENGPEAFERLIARIDGERVLSSHCGWSRWFERYISPKFTFWFWRKRTISCADREARNRRSSYTIFHDDYEY
ncbi:UNVERIFIED_CONTAM: HVA22-like protein a [Sesamum indicum]